MLFPIISYMILLPFLAAPLIYLIGKRNPSFARFGTLAVSLVILAFSLYIYGTLLENGDSGKFFGSFTEGPYSWIPAFPGVDYHVGVDGLSAPLLLLSSFLTVLVILGSWDLIKEKQSTYYMLILLFEGAIIGVFTSINLILFYVFWEIVLIPMFFFIGIWGGPRRKYAAMKFILFTYLGSLVMLLGFLLIYFASSPNTFNLLDLVGNVPYDVQIWASLAMLIGFGVKLPLVPFHTWLPDAHVEAPAPISVFLAGLLLKMGGYGFLRLNIGILGEASKSLAFLFIGLGVITMFYGAIVALKQTDLKRMIALTSINHMGFVVVGAFTANLLGVSGAIFQMFNHGIAIGLLFMLTGYIYEQTGSREIPLLKGMQKNIPRTAILLTLASLAGMGAPIFSLFLSEFMVIAGAISFNYGLAVAMLIPIITVSYFLWMIRRVVMSNPTDTQSYREMSLRSAITLSIYLIPLLLLVIFPYLLLDVIDPISTTLINALGG